jgi:hypothetical protein
MAACDSLDMPANAGVSFASSDFKLRIHAPLFFPVRSIISQSEFSKYSNKSANVANCHFDAQPSTSHIAPGCDCGVVFLGRRLGTSGRFRWPEGIAKCIVVWLHGACVSLAMRGASALNIAPIGTPLRFFRVGPPIALRKHPVWSHNP